MSTSNYTTLRVHWHFPGLPTQLNSRPYVNHGMGWFRVVLFGREDAISRIYANSRPGEETKRTKEISGELHPHV